MSGAKQEFSAGLYEMKTTELVDFAVTLGQDFGADGKILLNKVEDKVCRIIYEDKPGWLTVDVSGTPKDMLKKTHTLSMRRDDFLRE
jgi:hypothetical protein